MRKKEYKPRGKFTNKQMREAVRLTREGYTPKAIHSRLALTISEKTLMNHLATQRLLDPTIPYSSRYLESGRHLIRVGGKHLEQLRVHSAPRFITPQHLVRLIMMRLCENPSLVPAILGERCDETAQEGMVPEGAHRGQHA